MKINIGYITAVLVAAGLQAAAGADVTGKITLKGTPPPEKDLPVDPNCGKLPDVAKKTRFYLVGGAGELGDVFVYIKSGLEGKTFDVPTTPATLDQKGCEFHPYVFGLQTKQPLQIKNSDPLMHNINHAPTTDIKKRPQNIAQMAGSPTIERAFDKPEVFVRFKCDVHAWMFAYAGVVDHPYFAVTGKDGTFKLANVPPGKYEIEAIHRKAGSVTQEVTVEAANKNVDFTLEAKAQ